MKLLRFDAANRSQMINKQTGKLINDLSESDKHF